MRKLMVLLTTLMLAHTASADILQCWNAYAKKDAEPTLMAKIVYPSTLTSFIINRNEEDFTRFLTEKPNDSANGVLITTKRSPYYGKRDYDLGSGQRFILPASLNQESLRDALSKFTPQENAVIIGTFDGDGAGSHFSVRLRCVILAQRFTR